MDIEQLNKSQIVLLTLLISFVTSIATGIVTVSLMDQAPPVVAQTVNRVIERTVQSVAPAPKGQSAAAATVVTQEKTVVVTETDLISKAVAHASLSVVRVNNIQGSSFLSLGIVLDAQGTVMTDAAAIEDGDAMLTLPDGTHVRALVTKRDKETGLAFLQPATSTEKIPAWTPATISTDNTVLGTSVVMIAGKTVARIAPGVVTAMPLDSVIDTNITAGSIIAGSPLVDLDGNIIGISTSVSRAVSDSGFLTASVLVVPAAPAKK
jgi:hypothetical protein